MQVHALPLARQARYGVAWDLFFFVSPGTVRHGISGFI
jgi:hypothetical protein